MSVPLSEHHAQITSTQALLKERMDLKPDLPSYYWVTCDEQTEGRGRLGKSWLSPIGNFYASILVKDIGLKPITWAPLWVSCCLKKVVEDQFLLKNLSLKWPNDLYCNEKKIGGVLIESKPKGLIVGVGLNIAKAPLLNESTSLADQIQINDDQPRQKLMERILFEFHQSMAVEQVRNEYDQCSYFKKDEEIEWQEGDELKRGKICRLGDLGELFVSCENKVIALYSEEVRRVRKTSVNKLF